MEDAELVDHTFILIKRDNARAPEIEQLSQHIKGTICRAVAKELNAGNAGSPLS